MSTIVCKQSHCFYQDKNFCAKNITILNENGICLSCNDPPSIETPENLNETAITSCVPPKITIIEAKERKKRTDE